MPSLEIENDFLKMLDLVEKAFIIRGMLIFRGTG